MTKEQKVVAYSATEFERSSEKIHAALVRFDSYVHKAKRIVLREVFG